jgi:hypothetical protein
MRCTAVALPKRVRERYLGRLPFFAVPINLLDGERSVFVTGATAWHADFGNNAMNEPPSSSTEPAARLSQIPTIRDLPSSEIIQRYGKAIRRYLFALLKKPEDVDDVAQNIHVKILKGDLAKWDASRSRFRDFLKTVVRNAALDCHRQSQRLGQSADDLADVPDPHGAAATSENQVWIDLWREALIASVLAGMKAYQDQNPGNHFFTVVRLLEADPEIRSEQLAAALVKQTGHACTAENARQQKARARGKFAELLVKEVMLTVPCQAQESVEEELRTLGLFGYVDAYFGEAFTVASKGLKNGLR